GYTVVTFTAGHREALRLDTSLGTALARQPAAWLPLPILVPALMLALLIPLGVPDLITWPVAGTAFALGGFLIWGRSPLAATLITLAAPVTLVGYAAGEWAYATLSRPRRGRVWVLLLMGAMLPFAVGCIDLYLRIHTP